MSSEKYAFILIADEKYWKKLRQRSIASKKPLAFVRKGQVGPIRATKLLFYLKKPTMRIRGLADFIERVKGTSEEMWTRYGKETCFASEEEYSSFVQGREMVTFLRLRNLSEIGEPKTTEEIRMILGSLRGFRGKYVDHDTAAMLTT